jgi:hypothetical protein
MLFVSIVQNTSNMPMRKKNVNSRLYHAFYGAILMPTRKTYNDKLKTSQLWMPNKNRIMFQPYCLVSLPI